LSKVRIDDDDLFNGPPEGDRSIAQGILTFGALGIFNDLVHGGLTNIKIGVSLEVVRRNFLMY
jgi:hypothetical protein